MLQVDISFIMIDQRITEICENNYLSSDVINTQLDNYFNYEYLISNYQ